MMSVVALRREIAQAAAPVDLTPTAPTPSIFKTLNDTLNEWMERHRVRAELRELDDALLIDAGLDPFTARTEASRPFWQPLDLRRTL